MQNYTVNLDFDAIRSCIKEEQKRLSLYKKNINACVRKVRKIVYSKKGKMWVLWESFINLMKLSFHIILNTSYTIIWGETNAGKF